jgi:hypothetical protein
VELKRSGQDPSSAVTKEAATYYYGDKAIQPKRLM